MDTIDTELMGNKGENLGIELEVTLRLQLRGARDVWKSTLIGMVRGNYLIASIPHIPGLWVKLHQENHIIVRYLYRGKVYGFYSTLVGTMEEPFRLAFLSYPEKIEIVNLRKHERTTCLLPAQLSMDGTSYRGVMTDVSPGGCSFLFDRAGTEEGTGCFYVGDEVAFSVQFVGSSQASSINATIKNVKAVSKRTSIGAQFNDPDENLLQLIKAYVEGVGKFDRP